ncbi:MAPEG family protein [Brevundimonas sp. LjRoot202]|uniref:MAPEG family protein n=1 Tax=Brevundimonas sp. LjRoot202 TaxID=3342281 RepID=UPI003ECDCF1D
MHDHLTAVQAAGVWSGALIVLMVVLSIRVVLNRRKHGVLFGDGGVEQMTLASRAFGNAAEYIPIGIGALILLAVTGYASWIVHAVGATLFVGRLVHPIGLKFGSGPSLGRVVGMTLTWLALLGAAATLIICPHLR